MNTSRKTHFLPHGTCFLCFIFKFAGCLLSKLVTLEKGAGGLLSDFKKFRNTLFWAPKFQIERDMRYSLWVFILECHKGMQL